MLYNGANQFELGFADEYEHVFDDAAGEVTYLSRADKFANLEEATMGFPIEVIVAST